MKYIFSLAFEKTLRTFYFMLFLGIVLWVIIGGSSFVYPGVQCGAVTNITLLIPILFFLTILVWSARFRNLILHNSTILATRFIDILFVATFSLQFLIFSSIFFQTGWDVGVIDEISNAIVFGEDMPWWQSYLNRYPNNLLITWITVSIKRISLLLGVSSMKLFLCFTILINTSTLFLTCYSIYQLTKSRILAVWGFVFAFALVGISPWTVIPYSDSIALIIPVTTVLMYSKLREKERVPIFIRIIACAILPTIGYYIKPQCFVILIAIVCIELLAWLSGRFSGMCLLQIFSTIVLTITICSFIPGILCDYFNLSPKPSEAFGAPHFLMMGLNNENYGQYLAEDVNFSAGFSTKEERNAADIAVAVNRIKEYGVFGLLKHLLFKILVVFNDGTFAWGHEGNFFRIIFPEEGKIDAVFRSIYYPSGIRWNYYVSFAQGMWVSVLIACVFALLPNSEVSSSSHQSIHLVCTALIGITLFELIFEARARYLYCYTPLFIIAATCGINNLSGKFRR